MKDLRFKIFLDDYPNECGYDIEFYQEDSYLGSFIRRILNTYGATHESYLDFKLEERLLLFTGAKDCQGTEVYDGDILLNQQFGNKAFVRWSEGTGEYCGWTLQDMETGVTSLFLMNKFINLKIVGNVNSKEYKETQEEIKPTQETDEEYNYDRLDGARV